MKSSQVHHHPHLFVCMWICIYIYKFVSLTVQVVAAVCLAVLHITPINPPCFMIGPINLMS